MFKAHLLWHILPCMSSSQHYPPLDMSCCPSNSLPPCCHVNLSTRCGSHHWLTGKQQQQQKFAEEV